MLKKVFLTNRVGFGLCSLLIFTSLASHASVIYGFSGTYIDHDTGQVVGPVTFTAVSSSYIIPTGGGDFVPDALFVPGSQMTCDACTSIYFFADAVANGLTNMPSSAVGYMTPSGIGYLFYFPQGSFEVDGLHNRIFGHNLGTLTVTSATPEPGSLIMLTTGILSLAGFTGRRLM